MIQGNFATNNGGGIYYLTQPASLVSSNTLILANSALVDGGGAFGGNWLNCTISSNSSGRNGGGACDVSLDHCQVLNNIAATNGGGVISGQLKNCLLTGNHAQRGGAAYNGNFQPIYTSTITGNSASDSGGGIFAVGGMQLMGSIVYFNTAPTAPNYTGTINSFSCLTPLPAGTGNIDGDPAFIDPANGNFRLQTNSPCINTGGGPSSPTDLDDRPRFVGGHIDMGAYEFQGPGVGEFTDWLQQNGLPTSGSADHQDTDTDRMDNWQEWIAGTSPTNAASLLQMYSPSNSLEGITVTWQSVPGKTYFLQRSSDLATQPAFSSIESNLVGQAGFTSFTDSTATNHSACFYRVGVQ
ncbi:MAG TPA: choice-of-anchor Q domain-containing protein [Verrucomicrobiae bacterium]